MILDVNPKNIKEQLKKIPTDPGVYIYYDLDHEVIYVGKAKSLKKRVRSYWQKKDLFSEGPWKPHMVKNITRIKTITTKTEREALILESNTIKKYQPKYNSMRKDDKNYIFLRITDEEFPRVYFTREYDLGQNSKNIFGPYINGRDIRKTFQLLQKIFKFRVCKTMPRKPCLLYYINLCQAPCIIAHSKRNKKTKFQTHGISREEYKKQYNLTIRQIKLALRGELKTIKAQIKERMLKHSQRKEYERAAFWRDRLADMSRFASDNSVYFDSHSLYKKKGFNIAYKVKDKMNPLRSTPIGLLAQDLELPKLPNRIEGYDISNLNHQLTTGSMVVWENGKFDSNEYRRFRIKHARNERDDLRSLKEVLMRRLKHLPQISRYEERKRWRKPDLIMIDGGKAQFNTALEILRYYEKKFNEIDTPFNIRLCSLAKRFEILHFIDSDGNKKEILIKKKPYYKILGGLRDEAHRFAITYHRLLRSKNMTG